VVVAGSRDITDYDRNNEEIKQTRL
jgi:hypothetical protein